MSPGSKPQVEYRRLGKSGLRVSFPILGCMSFGSSEWQPWIVDEDKALPLLLAAWERGVTTWDTANVYSNGGSERIIAKAIKQFNIPRHRLTLLTKCHFLVADDVGTFTGFDRDQKDTRNYVNQSGLSRAAIFNQVEASLGRLNTDYIDLLQIHRGDLDNVSAEETMKALHDLVQAGKVRYIGASSMWTWQFQHYNHVAEKNGWTTFVSMQNRFCLTYREEEREMIKYCKFAGIGLIPYSVLGYGQLARPLGSDATVRGELVSRQAWTVRPQECENEIVRRVEKVAKDKGWLMSQVALAWAGDVVTSPLIGVSSVKRLEEAIIPGFKLTDEERQYLEEPYYPMPIKGHQ